MTRDDRLIWIDLEMTGLVPETDRIIEIATVVTDAELEVIAQGPVIAVRQSDAVLAATDEWNTRTHGASGLVARARASAADEASAERETLAVLAQHVDSGRSPMCGSPTASSAGRGMLSGRSSGRSCRGRGSCSSATGGSSTPAISPSTAHAPPGRT